MTTTFGSSGGGASANIASAMMASRSSSSSSSISCLQLLQLRCEGVYTVPNQFYNHFCRKRKYRTILHTPKLLVPNNGRRRQLQPIVTALDISCEGRFLLSGRNDGIVMLYDLSKWGRDHDIAPAAAAAASTRTTSSLKSSSVAAQDDGVFVHTPIAQGFVAATVGRSGSSSNSSRDPVSRNAAAIHSAKWYPTDSGAFVAASSNRLMIWDATAMESVVSYTPFPSIEDADPHQSSSYYNAATNAATTTGGGKMITSMDTTTLSPNTVIVSSYQESVVKLVDLRCGSSSHSLVGHTGGGGVLSVRWSPVSQYVLASGGASDYCIKLWDIRKSGSHACLSTLSGNGGGGSSSTNHHPMFNDDDNPRTRHGDPMISRSYNGQHYANLSQYEQYRTKPKENSMDRSGRKRKRAILQQQRQRGKQQRAVVAGPNDYRFAEGRSMADDTSKTTSSMDEPVRAIAFSSCGRYLVACGTKLAVWDLQKRVHHDTTSCTVCSGYKIPRRFTTMNGSVNLIKSTNRKNHGGRTAGHHPMASSVASTLLPPSITQSVPLSITDDGNDPTIWVGSGSVVLGYSLYGTSSKPYQELRGHLHNVAAMSTSCRSGGTFANDDDRIITSGQDGLMLLWGYNDQHNNNKYSSNKENGKAPSSSIGNSCVTGVYSSDSKHTDTTQLMDRDNW